MKLSLVEQQFCKLPLAGSIPVTGSKILYKLYGFCASILETLKGLDVNSCYAER